MPIKKPDTNPKLGRPKEGRIVMNLYVKPEVKTLIDRTAAKEKSSRGKVVEKKFESK